MYDSGNAADDQGRGDLHAHGIQPCLRASQYTCVCNCCMTGCMMCCTRAMRVQIVDVAGQREAAWLPCAHQVGLVVALLVLRCQLADQQWRRNQPACR